jgi:hypothetical protein
MCGSVFLWLYVLVAYLSLGTFRERTGEDAAQQ